MIASLRLGFLCIAVALLCCSCQPPAPPATATPPASSSVVDLDAVAKAMGWDVIISKRVELATQNLNNQLIQAAESMEKELKQQQAALGSTPTQEQVTAFQQAKLRVQQNIQNNKLVAQQARDSVRNQQVLLFRKEVKPVAAKLAEERGSKVVLVSDENVMWFDASADITGDVITVLRAQESSFATEPGGEGAETNQVDRTNAPAVPVP